MKLIKYILFFSFIALAICPTTGLIASTLKEKCEQTYCSNEGDCEKSDKDDCPLGMCDACPCCFCYFNCPVDDRKIEINVFQTTIKNNPITDQFKLSDYSSDCWQPPKSV